MVQIFNAPPLLPHISLAKNQFTKILPIICFLSISVLNAQNGEVKKYFDSGTLKSITNYVNDVEHGSFISYYENGIISEEGTMKNGELHGLYISNYKNGNTEEEITYVNDYENGPYKTYWETGELKTEGTSITVYDDGEYYDTLSTGSYIAILPSGEIIQKGRYAIEDNEEIEIGLWIKKDFYPKKKEDGTIDFNNLQIKEDFNLLNGEYHGICKEYYENGHLQSIGNYINGYSDGVHKEYFENGQLQSIGNYINNDGDGIHKEYYENGQLKVSTTFVNGNEIGLQEEFNENGTPNRKGNNGKKAGGLGSYYGDIGVWTYWEYFSNGQLERKYSQDEYGDYEGEYESYYENGDLAKKGKYEDDEKVGEWYEYFKDTNKKYKGWHENGEITKAKEVNSPYDSLEDEFYKIKFKNKCHKEVQVALRIRNLDGEWVSKGWFNIEAYDEGYLANTDNRIFYFTAHSLDKKNIWSGDEFKTIRGEQKGFKKRTIPENNGYGDYYLSLTCNK